jgi:multiple sugar transport system permease protein
VAADLSTKAKTWLGIASIPIILYTLLPIGWILSLSLKPDANLSDGKYLPSSPDFHNYRLILTGSAHTLFDPALRNSIGICLIATFLGVLLATTAAYAIARLDFPGKRLILTTALGVAVFPVISIVTPLFNLWRTIGLYNTWPGLIIPYLSLTLPLAIWVLSAFFKQIPWEMEQAAQVDGATTWQAFRKVVVPLAMPGVFTTAIITFFTVWNDFVYSSSLTSTSKSQTVPAALANFTGSSQFVQPTGAISAAAVIVTIPVVLLVLVFQKRIVSGLTAGAVKG